MPQIEAGETSATVTVATRIPVACAVTYGTTHDYGSLATDTDMAGGAHADHHPVLTGLAPDTVYFLRLQGVGPDGRLYRSEEFTFRTMPAAGASAEANLAATARIVGVSSEYGGPADGPFAAVRAVDGDPSTQWSSDGDGDDAWIEIELTAPTHVERVGFWTRTMGSSAQIDPLLAHRDRPGGAIRPLRAFGRGTNLLLRHRFHGPSACGSRPMRRAAGTQARWRS